MSSRNTRCRVYPGVKPLPYHFCGFPYIRVGGRAQTSQEFIVSNLLSAYLTAAHRVVAFEPFLPNRSCSWVVTKITATNRYTEYDRVLGKKAWAGGK